ncbi:MAG: DUF4268 domain-containing protein [Desulfobacula sp.]|nr:DUF4268 domain-containing protein [Desulfobacula sp.]
MLKVLDSRWSKGEDWPQVIDFLIDASQRMEKAVKPM